MSNPFLIVNIVEGDLNGIHQRKTFEEAVKLAIEIVAEQVNVFRYPLAEIESDFRINQEFNTSTGDIHVYITTAQED